MADSRISTSTETMHPTCSHRAGHSQTTMRLRSVRCYHDNPILSESCTQSSVLTIVSNTIFEAARYRVEGDNLTLVGCRWMANGLRVLRMLMEAYIVQSQGPDPIEAKDPTLYRSREAFLGGGITRHLLNAFSTRYQVPSSIFKFAAVALSNPPS